MTTSPQGRRWWTAEEDDLLRREGDIQQSQGGLKNWNAIAAKLPGRTNKDCRKRWHKLGSNIRKGAWTAAEHTRLQEAVGLLGLKWTQVAEVVGSRTADQCAKRWGYALDPVLSHVLWTEEQDERLIRAMNEHGHNWTKISGTTFQDRSTVNIKNRYFVLKRQQQSRSFSAPTAFAADDEDFSELSWSDGNDQDDQANSTALGIGPSGAIAHDQSSANAAPHQGTLDQMMCEDTPTVPLDLGEYFGFGNPVLGPYENGVSTQALGGSTIDYLQSPQNIDSALTMGHSADIGTAASSQGRSRTGPTFDRSNVTVDDAVLSAQRSMTLDTGRADTESRSHLRTLTLENVHPQTVSLVLNTLLSSNASFQMRLDNN
ncbi:MAG: hypothetical protein Q9169_005441 [Polycauliona sp. 2 TL-2023]